MRARKGVVITVAAVMVAAGSAFVGGTRPPEASAIAAATEMVPIAAPAFIAPPKPLPSPVEPAVPLRDSVAAVSVGLIAGEPLPDLNYEEDSTAEVDMNVVLTGTGQYVEVQATAEGREAVGEGEKQARTGAACAHPLQLDGARAAPAQ